MPHMYILLCGDNTYYVGSTWNLEARMEQHATGRGSEYTRRRLPVQLVYREEYERVDEAFRREKQMQNWSRAKRRALIDGTLGQGPEYYLGFARSGLGFARPPKKSVPDALGVDSGGGVGECGE